ncbi:MAG: Xaa-Pro dipeptidase [Gammaproteobacteria bacterium]|jgi:Xaa-Pro dipeptidase|nr:Xaa-Pro dipeptidase [Gammaproteobacteria bacterium]
MNQVRAVAYADRHVDITLYPAHLRRLLDVAEQALSDSGHARILIHSGGASDYFLDDRQVPFKVNPHYAWFVPEHSQHCGVLIEAGQKPQLFLHQPLDFWHAAPAAPEAWWADQFSIHTHQETHSWLDQINDCSDLAVIGDDPLLAQRFQTAAINPARLLQSLHLGRTIKTDWEISCLRLASQTAAGAHQAVADAMAPGQSEFALHLIYQRAAGQCEIELPYGNIVALNQHCAVLHFTALQKAAPAQLHSLLIDAGASALGYASDITRSYSANPGDLYAQLITAVDELQLQLVEQVRVGMDYRDLHVQAHRLIAAALQQLDVVRLAPDEQLDKGITRAFFPHGLGHYLGLQVHDVAGLVDDAGASIARPENHPFLRLTRKLVAGNVLTIEPGVYIIDQLLQPLLDKYPQAFNLKAIAALRPCGGVRIEDDVLVTSGAPVNLTREAFTSL